MNRDSSYVQTHCLKIATIAMLLCMQACKDCPDYGEEHRHNLEVEISKDSRSRLLGSYQRLSGTRDISGIKIESAELGTVDSYFHFKYIVSNQSQDTILLNTFSWQIESLELRDGYSIGSKQTAKFTYNYLECRQYDSPDFLSQGFPLGWIGHWNTLPDLTEVLPGMDVEILLTFPKSALIENMFSTNSHIVLIMPIFAKHYIYKLLKEYTRVRSKHYVRGKIEQASEHRNIINVLQEETMRYLSPDFKIEYEKSAELSLIGRRSIVVVKIDSEP